MRARMAVGVARTHADQGNPRCDGAQEGRGAVARAVVGHLEHVGAQRNPRREQVCLACQLDVAGEQHRARRGSCPHDQRTVIHRGAVVGIDPLRGVGRTDDLERQRGPCQPLPGHQPDERRACRRGLPAHQLKRPTRLSGRPDRNGARRPPAQRPGQPADVVGVQVAEHDEIERADPEPAKASVDRPVLRAGVDQHGPPRPAGGEHQRVALADIAGDDGPSDGWPARRHDPGRDQHQQQPEQRRQQHRAPPRRTPEGDRGQQHTGEQHRTAPPCGPGHQCSRDRGGSVGHRDQPADGGPGQPGTPLGERGAQRGERRGQHTEHGGGRDRGHHQQVRDDRDQADLAAEAGDERGGGEAGRGRHHQRLGRAGRHAAAAKCARPPRRDEHQRRGGQRGQGEARIDREARIGQQQGQRRGGERRDGGAAPAQREGQQHHSAHDGGAQHARRRPGQHHEPEDRRAGADRGEPRIGPQQPQQSEHRTTDDREICAADGRQMGEPGGAEILLHLGWDPAGVADRQTGQQARRAVRQHPRGVPQSVAQHSGRTLPPRGRADIARWIRHPQHSDRQVPALGGNEPPVRGDLLAGQQLGPPLGRGEQHHPAGGDPGLGSDLDADQLGGHQHLRDAAGSRAVACAAQRPRVVGQLDPQGGRRTALGRRRQRVALDQERVRAHQNAGRGGGSGGREHGGRPPAPPGQQGGGGRRDGRHAGHDKSGEGPGQQPEQHRRPGRQCGRNEPQVDGRPRLVGRGHQTVTRSRS